MVGYLLTNVPTAAMLIKKVSAFNLQKFKREFFSKSVEVEEEIYKNIQTNRI